MNNEVELVSVRLRHNTDRINRYITFPLSIFTKIGHLYVRGKICRHKFLNLTSVVGHIFLLFLKFL